MEQLFQTDFHQSFSDRNCTCYDSHIFTKNGQEEIFFLSLSLKQQYFVSEVKNL